ncbi:MAG: hypothetical protein R6U32_00690 [Candidatus Woesearchaeota archaeon]
MAKNMRRKEVRVCPKCGSARKSQSDDPNSGRSFAGGVSHSGHYRCMDCGYKGIFPVVDESELENFRKDLKKAGEKN